MSPHRTSSWGRDFSIWYTVQTCLEDSLEGNWSYRFCLELFRQKRYPSLIFFLRFMFPLPSSLFRSILLTFPLLPRLFIDTKAKFYRRQSEVLSKTKRRSIEDLSKIYRRPIEHLSNIYRTSIEEWTNILELLNDDLVFLSIYLSWITINLFVHTLYGLTLHKLICWGEAFQPKSNHLEEKRI